MELEASSWAKSNRRALIGLIGRPRRECADSDMDEYGRFVLILCTVNCLDDDLTITLLVN